MPLRKYNYIFLLIAFVVYISCKPQRTTIETEIESTQQEQFDWDNIQETGELIIATMNGPETYYQYHGVDMGMEFKLAEKFAIDNGLRYRVEVSNDTAELFKLLKESKVDIIALQIPTKTIQQYKACATTVGNGESHTFWAIRSDSPELQEELKKWYTADMRKKVLQESSVKRTIKRTVHVQYISQSKGIISPYDHLFIAHASSLRWDWRLLAAQCYQESAFDHKAVSWAGARGLMQIMPNTAREMGENANEMFNPEINIRTSARYLNKLQAKFTDIPNPIEKIKFILGAYNGGYNHIRDAMSLAQKYHKNPKSWTDVSYYVLHLSERKYYRDPVVKYGYMIGQETYNYVQQIMKRWDIYRGIIHSNSTVSFQNMEENHRNSNKFNRFNSSRNDNILSRQDSIFNVQP